MRVTVSNVVLLEGVSDIAAVSALAMKRGLDLGRVELVDLAGVTNVRRELLRWHGRTGEFAISGLCDAPEAGFVEQALHEIGHPVRGTDDLSAYGFFVCHADLEEELIRAVGIDRTVAVIEDLGLETKLATLRQQPAWQDRALADQLHRFCGVASGRKELLAGALAAALDPDDVPDPLQALLDRIATTP